MQRFLVMAAVWAGCSSTTAGPPVPESSSVSGSVGGVGLDALDSLSSVVVGPGGAAVSIGIANQPNACALATPAQDKANVIGLDLGVYNLTPGAAAISPGTYAVNKPLSPLFQGQGQTIGARFATTDAQCTETDVDATSGTITLTEISNSYVSGTMDVIFPGGDHLSGSFTSPHCDLPTGTDSDGGSTVCVP